MKNKNGITLIALIITIIVMLILVGVTINVAFNSGLFGKANYASKETQRNADREELLSAVAVSYNYENGLVDIDKLKEELGSGWTTEDTAFPYTFTKTKTNNSFLVYENGDIEDTEIYVNDFDIELYISSRTTETVTIGVDIDASNLVEIPTFADDQEALNFFYSTYGIEANTDLKEALPMLMDDMDYGDIVSYAKEEYPSLPADPRPEDVFIALMMDDYDESYTIKGAIEMLAQYIVEYNTDNKVIRVNGTDIDSIDWKEDGCRRAKFETPVFGNLEIEVQLDNYKAKGHIRAVPEDTLGDFYYEYDDDAKTARIYGLTSLGQEKINNGATEITIPEKTIHEGEEYIVTAIGGKNIFGKDPSITTIILPNTITSIGYGAFSGCSNLETINLPNNLTSIGDSAFAGCTNLQLSSIPNSVTSIGVSAFSECTSLGTMTLSNNLTSIGNGAFSGCTNLQLSSIPNSVTTIENYAFYNCTNLQLSSIPNSVTSIGDYAFYGITSLQSMTLSSNLTSIGENAFRGCTNLQLSSIPNSVTSIGNFAFDGCTSLQSMTLSSGLTSIGDSAFAYCINLRISSIPNGVTSIGNNAFYGCTSLQSMTLSNNLTSIGYNAFQGCTNLQLSSIPNSVTSIGNFAFYGCTSLQSMTLSSSLTSIGESVFNGCTNLQLSSIPNSVTSIGNNAFDGCTSLQSMTLSSSLTSIGDNAFKHCYNLSKIEIPFSVTTMGANVLSECGNLGDIYIVGRSSKPDGWDDNWQGWTGGAPLDGGGNVSTQIHWNASMP